MDFGSQYAFHGATAFQNFVPTVTPLTPDKSNSANSDDFRQSPPNQKLMRCLPPPKNGFDSINASDPYQGFDYSHGFNAHQQNTSFHSTPTPPTNGLYTQPHHQDPAQQLHASGSLAQAAATNGIGHGSSEAVKSDPGDGDLSPGHGGTGSGDGDDDESMTPAQSRRKAQNRAAQRAFRERKEKHVKDLEAKLADLEAAQQESSVENERLKRDLHKMSTENEILRATSTVNNGHPSPAPEPIYTGPMKYNPTDFYSNVLENHNDKHPSHRIVTSGSGERLLAAGATWDFILSHEAFKRGLVDVGYVSERLKDQAQCDGKGPVFAESAIIKAIEESVVNGSDDLI